MSMFPSFYLIQKESDLEFDRYLATGVEKNGQPMVALYEQEVQRLTVNSFSNVRTIFGVPNVEAAGKVLLERVEGVNFFSLETDQEVQL